MKYIQPGDQGRDVEVWQQFLAQIWLLELDRTLPGIFDDTTLEATRAYQVECGLEPTGIVDRLTLGHARSRGLSMIDNLVFRPPSLGKAFVLLSLFLMIILVTQCMFNPNSGLNMQGVQLPINPSLVPNSPQPRPCPGWFC